MPTGVLEGNVTGIVLLSLIQMVTQTAFEVCTCVNLTPHLFANLNIIWSLPNDLSSTSNNLKMHPLMAFKSCFVAAPDKSLYSLHPFFMTRKGHDLCFRNQGCLIGS